MTAAFEEVGSDPCGGWEDGAGLDFGIDLRNMSRSSQGAAMAALHENKEAEVSMLRELNGEKVADAEHDEFLEGALVLPDESEAFGGSMLKITGVACGRHRKSEELSNEVTTFIANPKRRKVQKHAADAKTSM